VRFFVAGGLEKRRKNIQATKDANLQVFDYMMFNANFKKA
jgi:hypothetical protein